MRMLDYAELRNIMGEQPYPLLFATVSGAHLYGFPSRDSDVDLRGVHVLPAAEVVGLRTGPETLDRTWFENEAEVDLVTHDLAKFARLMLRRNGYVLEQVLSPLVVLSTPEHEELVALAAGCITKWHAHHYRGFAKTQWEFFGKTGELKPLLYTFRVLLTGIHLMRTGVVQADLRELLDEAPAYLPDLMAAKAEAEHGALEGPSVETLTADIEALQAALDEAEAVSQLPDSAAAESGLHDFLVRVRLSR
ncbi:nucleotidyltransferase domain-containing protein [Kribbella albertanoniae]|uniref:Nucleotidyltransferase domain-containing protein n=2 Tax=Kribbella albertanoniae TaxID=1266829 RepID=A0A4R4Q991_9ACTN|nr:nucleotidyltransferase domain-containing protein [Kribbella albertanoniae]